MFNYLNALYTNTYLTQKKISKEDRKMHKMYHSFDGSFM